LHLTIYLPSIDTFYPIASFFLLPLALFFFFFFNDTAPTEIYTLSLHDALPIYPVRFVFASPENRYASSPRALNEKLPLVPGVGLDRKSTRLNSSHVAISYAVFCLKKKNNNDFTNPLSVIVKCTRQPDECPSPDR